MNVYLSERSVSVENVPIPTKATFCLRGTSLFRQWNSDIVSISPEPKTNESVSAVYRKFSEYVMIDIIDDGVGIPKELIANLFYEFSQISAQNLQGGGGSGM